jgi:hypothetical protein
VGDNDAAGRRVHAEDIGVAPSSPSPTASCASHERQELTTARQFEVLKMRGANYVTGRHFFEISVADSRSTRACADRR